MKDQPLTDTALPVHPQDIRKMLTSMKKGLFTKKSSKPKVPEDSQADVTSSAKANHVLIKSILKAVSDGGGGGREAEEEAEDGESEAVKKDSPPRTNDAGGGEGGSEGKGKLVKTISERVSTEGDLLPEQLEMPVDIPPPTEEERVVVMQDRVCRC